MRTLTGVLVAVLVAALAQAASAQTPPDPGAKVRLAQLFLATSHHREIIAHAYEREMKLSWHFCKDSRCRTDLDDAIDRTIPPLMDQYELDYAKLLAARLSEGDLQAALTFARSPEGQAVANAQDSAAEDIGALGHQYSALIYVGISNIFCARHKDICTVKSDHLFRTPGE